MSRENCEPHAWPDVSLIMGAGTLTCGHSTPSCARAANRAHCFLVKQCSTASLTVAVSMYLRVASATSCQSRFDP